MFKNLKWQLRKEAEQKQRTKIQTWIREADEQRRVTKLQDKMEWMTRDLLKAIVEK